MSAKLRAERPLSPHLQIYGWSLAMTMSILHRVTGFGLAVGTLLLGTWLWAAAFSPECYAWLTDIATSIVGRLFMFGWTAAFFYHLLNGVRHLIWDAGIALNNKSVFSSGVIVLLLTFALTGGVWAYVLL